MGTRVEKYKKKQRKKRTYFFRMILVLCVMAIFFGGLIMVDNSYRSIMNITDKSIFHYQHEKGIYSLQLFGDKYSLKKLTLENFGEKGGEFLVSVKRLSIKLFNVGKKGLSQLVNYISDI